MTNNTASNSNHRFEVKAIVEPKKFVYEAPKPSTGLGFLGGLQQKSTAPKDGLQLSSSSLIVNDTGIIPSDQLTPDLLANMNLDRKLLYQFKEIMSDSATESKVKAFLDAKERIYSEYERKSALTSNDLSEIEQAMKPYDIGYVVRVQLVVTITSDSQFPGAKLSRDGKWRLSRKSKQALRPYLGNMDLTTELEQVKAMILMERSKVETTDDGTRLFTIDTVTRADGSTYRRLISNGNENLYSRSNEA